MKILLFISTFLIAFMAEASYQRMTQNIKLPTQAVMEQDKVVPVAAASANILSASPGAISGVPVTVTTFLAQPDMARNLVVTPGGTTADVAAGDVVVTGTDARGKVITEAFTFPANASSAVVGVKAFGKVTSVLFPAEDSPFGATWSVGVGDKIGFKKCMDGIGYVIKGLVDGVALTGITPLVHSTDLSQNGWTPNPVANGTRAFNILYVQNFRCD